MAKKCKNCKVPFVPKYSSLEKYCGEVDCRIAYSLEVVRNKKKLEEKKTRQKMVDNTTNWKSRLQDEINSIVRRIDKGLLCLARNKGGQIHAGHVYARGGNTTIRYNLHNIHRQNAQSNHFQNDDGLLREGLVKEYGQDYMDFISDLRRTPKLEYKDFDYKGFYIKAHDIALRLAKLDLTYSLKNRISLRNKINEELEIYEQEYCQFNKSNYEKTD